MTFGNPFYLWTLLGLLVPIAIHLWSKKEAKIIKIGSIKLLSPSDSKQSSRIKLNELWLLVLRMFILAIIAIIISEPQWQSKLKNSPLTYIVDPAVLKTGVLDKVLSEHNNASEVRLLAENLPVWDGTAAYHQENAIPDYWQLLREINFLNSDSIIVIAPTYVQGFKGKRPEISRAINWIQYDSIAAKKQPLQVLQHRQDLKLFSAFTSKNQTAIIKENLSTNNNSLQYNDSKDRVTIRVNGMAKTLPITTNKPIEILLNFSDSLMTEKPFLETAFQVLAKYLDSSFELQDIEKTAATNYEKFDLVIWFSAADIPKNAKRLLVFKEDEYANKLIQETASNGAFQLTSHLNIENSISGNLTEKLLEVLALDVALESQIKSVDKRQLEVREVVSNTIRKKASVSYQATIDMTKWFWILLLFLMILERFIANFRKQ